VAGRYRGTDGRRRRVAPSTLAALAAALDGGGAMAEAEETAPLVVVRGGWPGLDGPAEVELEGGEVRGFSDRLPGDLPLGYHRLHREGRSRPLIVTPPRCHLPAGLHTFGFAVQLYAARSHASWGIGDLADLAEIGRWARGLGAGALLVNPLHAALPVPPVEPSPYSPASRLFLNPLYLRPEADTGGPGLDDLAGAARALNRERRIERDRVLALKLTALQRRFAATAPIGTAEAAMAGLPLLGEFALFCALAEREGPDWRSWPTALARRDPAALRKAAGELAERVRFHAWVQTLLDAQMAEASAELPLIQDLPVGFQPGGADAWLWQDLLAPGVTIGAPPDMFNPRGQDWGLPAFSPGKLRAAGYDPFIQTIRASLRHGGNLRIDHVMGLCRLWLIPPRSGPAEGAYVGYPLDDLLGIVALESVRHHAIVIGEDLGTVPSGLRGRLRRRGLLSYVLLLFDGRPPARWPRQALAAVTTHDLPTVAGLWDGSDLAAQRRLALSPSARMAGELVERIGEGGLDRGCPAADAIVNAHRQLALSPCALIAATLEDVAAVRERPNQPGTTTAQNPNWSLALPLPLEELRQLPMATRLAGILRRGAPPPDAPVRA
jgi:4-alpha-glucanotransferase